MTSTTLMGRARFNRCRSPRGPAGRRCGRYDDPIRLVSTGARPRGDLRSGVLRQKISPTASGFNRCRSPRGPAGPRPARKPVRKPPFQQVQVPEGTCGRTSSISSTPDSARVSTGAGPRGDLRDVRQLNGWDESVPFQQVQVPEGTCGRWAPRRWPTSISSVSTGAGPRGDLRATMRATLVALFAVFQQVQVPEGTCGLTFSSLTLMWAAGFQQVQVPEGTCGLVELRMYFSGRPLFQQVQVPEGTCGHTRQRRRRLRTEVSTGAGPRGDLRGGQN